MNTDIIILMDEETALKLLHEHYERIMQSRRIIARALDYLKRTGSSRLNRYPAHLAECELKNKHVNVQCAAAIRESCSGILRCAAHLEEIAQTHADRGGVVIDGRERRFIDTMFPSYPDSLRKALAADLVVRVDELNAESKRHND